MTLPVYPRWARFIVCPGVGFDWSRDFALPGVRSGNHVVSNEYRVIMKQQKVVLFPLVSKFFHNYNKLGEGCLPGPLYWYLAPNYGRPILR